MIGSILVTLLALVLGAPAGSASDDAPTPAAGRDSVAVAASERDTLAAAPRVIPSDSVGPTVIMLPEVTVTRARVPSEARRRVPTAFVTELRTGASGRALETLSEVMSQAAGVRIVDYGGLGSFSAVTLRGAPSGQLSLYLDGVPLTSAAHGVVSLADLPATAIDRIEVYRALAPLSFGVATPGGAINLVTVSNPSLRELRVARGTYDTWEGLATAGLDHGPFTALIHAGYQGSSGAFRFADDNATPLNRSDDSVSTRHNNRFDAATLLATLGYRPTERIRVTLREDLFHKAQGIPGIGTNPALHPRLDFLRSITDLEIARRGEQFWPDASLSSSLDLERTGFRDDQAKLRLGFHDTDDRFRDQGVKLGLEWPRLPAGASLQTSASLRNEWAGLRDALDGVPDPPVSRRVASGVSVAAQLRPLGEWLTLHAGRRWDRLHDERRWNGSFGLVRRLDVTRDLVTPQLGITLAAPFGLELRSNWTDARRAPDFLELFGNQGVATGNPELRPERGRTWDVGGAWSGAYRDRLRAALEVAHYESRTENLIIWVPNSPNSFKPLNVTRAFIRGEECAARLAAPGGFDLSGSMTWQTAIDQGSLPFWNGKRLPQRPERVGYASLGWSRGRLGTRADVLVMSEDYLDRYNRTRVPAREIVGARVSVDPLGGRMRVSLEGKNLGDRRVTDVAGYPLPGRMLFVSLECRLGPARLAEH